MAQPNDEDVQTELLRLLSIAPEGRMHCRDVYLTLAAKFPRLTKHELEDPYRSSISHWANRVQFARLHLVEKGWVHRPATGGGRSYWTITPKGRKALADLEALGKSLLAELEAMSSK